MLYLRQNNVIFICIKTLKNYIKDIEIVKPLNNAFHMKKAVEKMCDLVNHTEYMCEKAVILFYEQNNIAYFKELFIKQFAFVVKNYFG